MHKSPFNPDIQHENTGPKVVVALERISEAFRVLLWNESKTHGLSPIQVQVLIFLKYHSPDKCKVSFLADEFNMTKATISDTVKALMNKKLIEKDQEPGDARSFIINLTPNGASIAEQTEQFTREILEPVENLPAETKEQLFLSLTNIIHHLNRAGIITIQRMCQTCLYYRTNHQGAAHYCELLGKKLESTELRLDCPEHELLSTEN
ncbi:MAG: MarR family transcriptional regulator [Balneolaceae bacterium]|nr:MAG: MarR family transcriptional regulator [Balneolaceae bacterium]